MWRKRIEEAESYEDFLKVRIADKEETDHWKQTKRELERSKKIDGALPSPVMGRSQSFSVKDESTMNSSPSPKKKLSRNLSFSEKHGNSPEAHFAQTLSHYDNPIVMEELGEKTTDLLVTTTARLKEARMAAEDNDGGAIALKYLLSAVIKRNHLNLDDVLIQNARSIAECGEYGLTSASRKLIRAYYEEVENGLNYLCESIEKIPLAESTTALETARESELMDRITLVRKMKQNMGRTALMLSGGGAQAMYHLGIIRGLIESKQYDNIKVISGTSGGSIIAAMCAICKSDELFKEVCVPEVSTDYRFDGEMKKQNIRWFPSMTEMAAYWVKNKLMVDSAEFRRTCQFYYSDITFEEAFEKTGKHVCITVSASRSHGGGNSAQRLLLNHISTPHVTIASAVAASCALPGVMAPAKLIAKSSTGELEPFEVDGVEWIDGSVQADLPFQRISTLFAVSSFIVSQTNFHIVPFLNKEHHPTKKSKYWQFFQHLEWDIRGRALKLSRLGLFPRIFGQDISKVFKQKYFGDLTLCPRFTTMQVFGLKALSNPSLEDMKVYLKYGQLAAWPYLNAIRDMIRLEKALDECVGRLEGHMDRHDGDWSNQDEIDSIASGSGLASSSARVKIIGRPPIGFTSRGFVEADRNRRRMMLLEDENRKLRDELVKLKSLLPGVDTVEADDESKLESDGPVPLPVAASLSEGSEGAVWSIVLQQKK
jgi:predicted acylesterase/phospholipase RssA